MHSSKITPLIFKILIDFITKKCNFEAKSSIENSYKRIENIKHIHIPQNSRLLWPNDMVELVSNLLDRNKVSFIAESFHTSDLL